MALPDADFAALRGSGALKFAYNQILSLEMWPTLVNLSNRQRAHRDEIAKRTAAIYQPADDGEIQIDWSRFKASPNLTAKRALSAAVLGRRSGSPERTSDCDGARAAWSCPPGPPRSCSDPTSVPPLTHGSAARSPARRRRSGHVDRVIKFSPGPGLVSGLQGKHDTPARQ